MSKRAFKSQASSARAASTAFGSSSLAFGVPQSAFQTATSPFSYITEQPDLSGISNPQIVVAFKNLGKKDSITKAKALEELQGHLSPSAGNNAIETAVLDAWANLYTRTSIDNSRRVRQLAHTLQGWITVSCGKRMVPYLPKTIGSWLAGLYDTDKGVARCAQDALQATFSTPEKVETLWKIYRKALLDYVEDAMLVQSQQTLSDERTTSPDDSEAKHVRVVSSAALILLQLIKRESSTVSMKNSDNSDYAKLLSSDKLWEYAYHKDASMRRALYLLILPIMTSLEDHLDYKVISTCFLAKALQINQLGSSGQYVDAVMSLTQHRPQIWTTDYISKTSASRRLFQFLKKGSQRGPESFWTNLGQLVRIVPTDAWRSTPSNEVSDTSSHISLKDAQSLLEALHEGVISAEEPRQNASIAWSTYASTALWLLRDPKSDDSRALLETEIYPIIKQHISNEPSASQWSIPAVHTVPICSRILVSLAASEHEDGFSSLWNMVSSELVDSVKVSLPESSKDFRSSQDAVIAKADRLFKLQEQVTRSVPPESSARSSVDKALKMIISDCVKVLRDRNGKPYGAAGTIAAAAAILPADSTQKQLDEFIALDLSSLLTSPSGSILISILLRSNHYPSYLACFDRCVKALLEDVSFLDRENLLTRLLQEAKPLELYRSPELVTLVTQSLDIALGGDLSKWRVIKALLGNKHLLPSSSANDSNHKIDEQDLSGKVLSTMMNSLSMEQRQDAAITGFEDILSDSASANSVFEAHVANQLLPKLLHVADSPDEDIARRATELSSKLRSLMKKLGSITISTSTSDLLRQQFEGSGQLISVFGMVELAEQTLKESDDALRPKLIDTLLPSAEHWQVALEPFVNRPPLQASAITSPLQGIVYTIENNNESRVEDLPRDSDDFSTAMRLAIYVTKLLSDEVINISDFKQAGCLYLYYPQVLQLVNEKVTIDNSSALWLSSNPEVVDEAVNVMSTGQKLVHKWVKESAVVPEGSSSIVNAWREQVENMRGNSPKAYVVGLCFSSVMATYLDILGPGQALGRLKNEISAMHRSENIVQSAALILALQGALPASAEGIRLCNELIADATELRSSGNVLTNLRPLILLNMLLHDDNGLLSSVPTQRVVFLFQNLVRLLVSNEAPQAVRSEVYKLLCYVVVVVSDIYGEYWEQILDATAYMWEDDDAAEELPVLNSSLRLYARLRSLLVEETNDDLLDAWKAKKSRLDAGLLHVLKSWAQVGTANNQPRDITAESLARQLRTIEVSPLSSVEGLYPLLGSEQYSVQTATYELLHRAIPAKQEQISLDIALENKVVQLPKELLSLVVNFAGTGHTSKIPRMTDADVTRAYLLTWTVVFDNFTNASFKLREMYHAEIKSSVIVTTLLDTICNLLRITSGRPVDASKFLITSIALEDHDLLEKERQSIAIYLYYQALLHVPDLVKEWFIEQKNRIKSPLESWTQKHISPLIVAASLEAATEWAATQDQDDRPVSIKPSPRASELVASVAIDEESPPISLAISLPGAYPLEQALVTGRNRVGVSDKNWQSWLRTFQIIIFSTGNLVEGLIAFRRNVQGALKGQTECAICYSIIGTDMKTPDKKCGTCKNTFHSVCLFRWFKSSNSSSCPLCRNNFNYA